MSFVGKKRTELKNYYKYQFKRSSGRQSAAVGLRTAVRGPTAEDVGLTAFALWDCINISKREQRSWRMNKKQIITKAISVRDTMQNEATLTSELQLKKEKTGAENRKHIQKQTPILENITFQNTWNSGLNLLVNMCLYF